MKPSKITIELEGKITKEMEDKYFPKFEKQSRYMGNGIYSMADLYSTDTRELFLMFVAQRENIKKKKN